ncbi:3-hydroxyacyl-CoA dehydrogenase [Streptomyces tateyamensis]|uniref:3-hydroxyacyl-CoA dehydrogenase n=1 Tax=Streptomyces tateyamensis TaxID=565073 RepID=A0A2V4NJB9_9ACTN|nr:3-hydroxyacyl-CoA dehydrogenase NAD-binding domain-containing protein [Streptomyces tateyamensis]PYC71652.1 3-hydroxyacyl-CoA dehydrogenase [Streptomyces tateyamensis]
MSETTVIRWEQDQEGIVTLVLDDPQQSVNTMNAAFTAEFVAVVERLAATDGLRGVIITSAKKTFFAGGDLKMLGKVDAERAGEFLAGSLKLKQAMRTLETLGKPVVAAINGSALGGGLELALACHHRVALDVKGSKLGFPEVTLGLLPGGGGVVRTVRLLGLADALLKWLLTGRQYAPAAAVENGLVHELASSPEELLAKARAFVVAHESAQQPWDVKGYKIPGGTPSTPALAAQLPAYPANLRKQLNGAPYPAPRNILAAAVESSQVDVDTAFVIEARYFTELAAGQTAKNMIQALFFDMNAVNAGASRPAVEGKPVTRVAVLGAGMMGAGIAYSCARAGLDVVLKDVSLDSAERGKAYSAGLLDKAVARGRKTAAQRDELLARIKPTASVADLAGCDVVIEAVFENVELKHQVFQEVLGVVAPDALLCSNTSTLPISLLAKAVDRDQDFIGLHFFSPVDKMPLVEIIRGERTGEEAVARAFDLVRAMGKTPIVVNDSRGFFTSRVIGQFINEGVAMVAEGIEPASIEQAAAQAGYPAKVLSLLDELTLTLPRKIRAEARRAVEESGGVWEPHPAEAVLDRMVEEFDRPGRSGGAGFYDYAEDGSRLALWPGLREHFARPDHSIPFTDMKERMLFAEALDSVRCLDERVLTSVADANVGSILGIGFPAWTGGVLQYINGYEGGVAGFTARARELAAAYGARFTPPPLLERLAAEGGTFTD